MSKSMLLAQWKKGLEAIRSELRWLCIGEEIFKKMHEIVTGNPEILQPNLYHKWVIFNYGIALASGIRRQMDTDKRSRSLINLLKEMRCNVHCIPLHNARKMSKFVGARNDHKLRLHICDRLDADIMNLENKLKTIKKYVNKRVAHSDRKNTRTMMIKELHEGLKVLNKLIESYSIMIEGDPNSPSLTLQAGWDSIFMKPWIVVDKT